MELQFISVALLLLLQPSNLLALDNGLALTPPMGWLAWERYACDIDCTNDPDSCINEKLFMDMADHMASHGFRNLGYDFINIDDCWATKMRDDKGMLQADPVRFPNGIKALADYVHSKGLKLGIYGDLGSHTCGGYPGSLGYVEKDAKTFADWGVDMLKLDGCYASEADYETGYPEMSKALNATGRPIVFSCSWPAYIKTPNYTRIAEVCNLWRNYDDINDSWDSVLGIITHYAQNQDQFQPFAAPGQWNDPDMLIIGDFGLSLEQQKAQMAMWAIFAAPLFMSNDLRKLPKESKDILQNKEVIAINQDKMGKQGRLIASSTTKHSGQRKSPEVTNMVFARPLDGGDLAVAMLNTGHFSGPHNITVSFKDAGVSWSKASVRDVMNGMDLGMFTDSFSAPVNPTGVRLVRLTPAK